MLLFIGGALAASVIWFLIIRNNRSKFEKTFDELQAKYDNLIASKAANAAAQKSV